MSEDKPSPAESKLAGIALLKPEYIILNHERSLTVECLTDNDKRKLEVDDPLNGYEPDAKMCKLMTNNKKLKGQNKNRGRTFTQSKETLLCSHLLEGKNRCLLDKCEYNHDIKQYLAEKPPDIASTCPVFSIRGRCPRGITCRFGAQHINENNENIINVATEELWNNNVILHTKNTVSRELLMRLRKREYDFRKSENVLNIDKIKGEGKDKVENVSDEVSTTNEKCKPLGPVEDSDIIRLSNKEKKKVDWKNKLYLSPLTTVGNLPFRRICKQFGADITCGEMAMATSLLQSHNPEWALVKRHGCEDLFGVQICGNNPSVLTKCAQVLQEQTDIDFVDVNLGCPIDLVYRQGGGCGLLRRENMLIKIAKGMSSVLDVPLTMKMRTGVYNGKSVAHSIVPKLCAAGVSLITVHGRSREQRYTKNADWDYIEQCAKLAALESVPLFGNGDVLCYDDYKNITNKYPSVAGTMIGRGALIKPWIFTEIKEERLWDITSGERFDILKKFVNYGLDHWGTDTKGVENTRRFLLEWLSFLYRYIPVGLLERPPQKINERPPSYRGRNDLETLMASPNCADWIKISEMLLGQVPDGFRFLPKHKANSWR